MIFVSLPNIDKHRHVSFLDTTLNDSDQQLPASISDPIILSTFNVFKPNIPVTIDFQ